MGGRIMATTINSSTSNGIVITPDTSGEIELQANGVTKAKVTANGLQDANGNSLSGGSFRNLIINGDMRIDQRNAGASVTPTNAQYHIDRWRAYLSQASKYTVQQSTTAPSGFNYSLLATSSSAYTVGASDYFLLAQTIEGLNSAHLAWGTSAAKTVTLSFWVRSSLTGTFGGAVGNAAGNRSYPYSYTISSADTWEKKTITISGDTSGTWVTTNASSVVIYWSLGSGSSSSGTAGAWSGTYYDSVTGATSLVGTSGATFYITGVQLEVGEGASDFEFLPYDVQLQRCQRYFEVSYSGSAGFDMVAVYRAASNYRHWWDFKVEKRTSPTIALGSGATWGTSTPSITVSATRSQFESSSLFNINATANTISLSATAEL
jgi:hypothetical protein